MEHSHLSRRATPSMGLSQGKLADDRKKTSSSSSMPRWRQPRSQQPRWQARPREERPTCREAATAWGPRPGAWQAQCRRALKGTARTYACPTVKPGAGDERDREEGRRRCTRGGRWQGQASVWTKDRGCGDACGEGDNKGRRRRKLRAETAKMVEHPGRSVSATEKRVW